MAAIATVTAVSLVQVSQLLQLIKTSPRTIALSMRQHEKNFIPLQTQYMDQTLMARRVMLLFAFGYNTEISYLRNHQYYPCLAFRILAI